MSSTTNSVSEETWGKYEAKSYDLKIVPETMEPRASLEDLRKHFNEKGIFVRVHEKENLLLLKYKRKFCDITDEDVRKCRGLILDYTTYEPVCVPPFKSVELKDFVEKAKDNEDKVQYEEFLDGTMINLFHHTSEEHTGWFISTRSCIGAKCRWYSDKEFKDLFEESKNFSYDKFEKDVSYTFVLQHPENRIVKHLDEGRVVLVEANRINGFHVIPLNLVEVQLGFFNQGLVIDIPEIKHFKSIEEARRKISQMSYEEQGWVLKFNNMRTKIRNPRWKFAKDLRGNSNSYLRNYLELRQNGFMQDYLNFFPEMQDLFQEYMTEIHTITQNLFGFYQSCFVKKTMKHKDVPYIYKPLCYELHKNYLENNTIVSFAEVKKYINRMPIPRQMFLFRNKDKEQPEQELEQEDNTE